MGCALAFQAIETRSSRVSRSIFTCTCCSILNSISEGCRNKAAVRPTHVIKTMSLGTIPETVLGEDASKDAK